MVNCPVVRTTERTPVANLIVSPELEFAITRRSVPGPWFAPDVTVLVTPNASEGSSRDPAAARRGNIKLTLLALIFANCKQAETTAGEIGIGLSYADPGKCRDTCLAYYEIF